MREQEELERARLHFEDNLADVVRIADLEAENARLRADLTKTRRDDLEVMNRYADERDRYKAQAERRGEAQGERDIARERAYVLAESLHRHHSDALPPCDRCSPTASLVILGEPIT